MLVVIIFTCWVHMLVTNDIGAARCGRISFFFIVPVEDEREGMKTRSKLNKSTLRFS
jgi:hypothetical protein